MSKISVIIPVYGVEKYIERCACSLFEQTLDDIEYIFVNDCTPDNSILLLKKVLEKYPNRQSQVRIINQPKNMGAAQARKDGILISTGDFIIQCDSDDWVDSNMYMDMLTCAYKNDADLVICKKMYKSDGENNRIITNKVITDELMSNKEEMMSLLISGKMFVSLCNRLVKRDLFFDKRFIFPGCHMKEDVVISTQLAYLSKKSIYIEGPYYYYYNNNSSVCMLQSENAYLQRCEDVKNNIEILMKFLSNEKKINSFKSELNILKFQTKGFLLPLLKQNLKYWRYWYNVFPEINFLIFFEKGISFNLKFVHLLTLIRVYHFFSKLCLR